MEERDCGTNFNCNKTQTAEKEKCESENSINVSNTSNTKTHIDTFSSSEVHGSSIISCGGKQHSTSERTSKSENILVDPQIPQHSNSRANVTATDSKGHELDLEIASGTVKDGQINPSKLTLKDLKKCPLSTTRETPSCSSSVEDFVDGFNSASCQANVPSTSSGSKSAIRSAKSIEMQHYIDKLREMVPYAKNTPKLSKVQLIHCAIDYITDLQEALEARVKRKKTLCPNASMCRLPLSDLPVSQQSNSSNISDPPSPAAIQFTRHHNSPDDLQRVMPHPTSEPTNDSPDAIHQSANQSVNPNNDPITIPKSEEIISDKTKRSPQSFKCIQTINQMFIRNVQEEKLKKFSVNKIGESIPERTIVKVSSERESHVNQDGRVNETAPSVSEGPSNNTTEGGNKIRMPKINSDEHVIKSSSSNSDLFLNNKRKLEEL